MLIKRTRRHQAGPPRRRLAPVAAAAAALAVPALSGAVLLAPAASAQAGPTQVTLPFTGLSYPFGVAADSAGDVYVADDINNRVVELPAGATSSSQQITLPFTGLTYPEGVAVDAAGDVYAADTDNNRVVELPAGATSSSQQITLPFTGLDEPFGVAVDSAGDVYVADTDNGRVVELPAGATSSSQQITLPFTGLNKPDGVAVDSAGDVYAADSGNGRVVELPAGATSSSQQITLPFTGLNFPQGVAVDSAGDVYVADTDNGRVVELPAGATSSSQQIILPFTGLIYTYGVAVDGAGDVYVTDTDNNRVVELVPATQAITVTSTPPSPAVAGGTYTPAATGGGSGNPVIFSIDPASTAGACSLSSGTVTFTGAGTCIIDANQAGGNEYSAAPQAQQTITVIDLAPAFTVDSPPTTATAGQAYSYAFVASGIPAPTYSLAAGAPSWLSVDSSTGTVGGTVPTGIKSFSYSVIATNGGGTATAGPFTVTVTRASVKADLAARLSCPAGLKVGETGTCTLTVTNNGPAEAKTVIAAVALPAALAETSCGGGCTRHANVFTWSQSSLAAGASVQETITVRAAAAGRALVLGAAASASPDPDRFNNISLATVTISK